MRLRAAAHAHSSHPAADNGYTSITTSTQAPRSIYQYSSYGTTNPEPDSEPHYDQIPAQQQRNASTPPTENSGDSASCNLLLDTGAPGGKGLVGGEACCEKSGKYDRLTQHEASENPYVTVSPEVQARRDMYAVLPPIEELKRMAEELS